MAYSMHVEIVMRIGRTILGGALGAFLMTISMVPLRALGAEIRFEYSIGSAFTGTFGPLTWLLGFMIHVALGVVFAFVYAASFEYLFSRAGFLLGAVLGVGHAALAGFLLLYVPILHPLMPGSLPAPGMYFSASGGIDAAFFFVLYILFGAVVGGLYGEPVMSGRAVFAHQR